MIKTCAISMLKTLKTIKHYGEKFKGYLKRWGKIPILWIEKLIIVNIAKIVNILLKLKT